MGSRLKENPDRTFHWFFEATCPIARDKNPGLLFQFPEDFSDEESREILPRFCFPYDIHKGRQGVTVQHFTFVLTDLEGCQRFGFCRLANSSQTCLCLLSYLPWFEVFYKLLNHLADYFTRGQTNEMKRLLAKLYEQPIPFASGSVTLQLMPYFIAPDPRSLPSIPESRNLTELVVAVDAGNLIQLYASMLFERRILLMASKLSTLTACIHALGALLYPMFWQHIFIPVLPPHLLEYCCAPMPYLIGVHSSLAQRVKSSGLEDVIMLNVDTNTLETPFDDLKRIPSDVMSELKVRLKNHATSPGWGVAKAFLRAQASLFGGYRDALQEHKEGKVCFSEDLFLHHRSHSMRQFLQDAVHLQFFKQFIDGRLELLNKGMEPDDLFEEEIVHCEREAGNKTSYRQLVGNLKKGGDAFLHNVKSKANMTTKGFTKRGLRNLLIAKDHNDAHFLQRTGSVTHRRAQSDSLQSRLPITNHFGRSRPRRPVHKHRSPGEEEGTDGDKDSRDGALSGQSADSDIQKDEEEEDSLLCDPEKMDLLGEIFDTLSSRNFQNDGLLYGTRSLDLLGSASQDYITKRGLVAPSQESLCLSISGSESLYSWNLEEGLHAPEEESELTEDFDSMSLDQSVPEERESWSPLVSCEQGGNKLSQLGPELERRVSQEEKEIQINIKQDDQGRSKEITNDEEANLEENTEKQQEQVHCVQKRNKEEVVMKGLGGKEEEGGEDEAEEGGKVQREGQETINTLGELESVKKGKESQEGKDKAEIPDVFLRDSPLGLDTKLNYQPNSVDTVKEHQGQVEEVNPTITDPPGTGKFSSALRFKLPLGQKERADVTDGEQGYEAGLMSEAPKVMSAGAKFQCQASGQGLHKKLPIKSQRPEETGKPCNMIKSWRSFESYPQKNSSLTLEAGDPTEPTGEEALPPPKVSELKKRFEA